MSAPTGWRKSRYSAEQTACVEVGRVADGAAVRDSKDRAGGYLTVDRARWSAFLAAIDAGVFDDRRG